MRICLVEHWLIRIIFIIEREFDEFTAGVLTAAVLPFHQDMEKDMVVAAFTVEHDALCCELYGI